KIRAGDDLWRMELEYYLQGRLNLEMQRVARARNIPFFDGDLFPPDKRPFFIDQIHPNGEGANRIATALTAFLERLPDVIGSAEPAVRRDSIQTERHPSSEYGRQMVAINDAIRRLGTSVAERDLDAVVAEGSRLRDLFAGTEAFWSLRPNAADARRAANQ